MSKEDFSEREKTFGRREFLVGLTSSLALAACKTRSKIKATKENEEELVSNHLILRGKPNQDAVDYLKSFPGLKWIGKLEGNGHREVLIYAPLGTDMSKPVELIYHFHGTHGELISGQENTVANNRVRQVADAAQEVAKAGRNIVVVYPLSKGPRPDDSFASRNGYDDHWMKKGSGDNMQTLHDGVIEALKTDLQYDIKVDKLTMKGHSAGGRPLQNVAESGFKVDRIDFLDASYPGWATGCYQAAIKSNPDLEMNVFYKPNRSTNRGSAMLQGKKGVQRIPTKLPHRLMNIKYFGWERRNMTQSK